MCILNGKFKLKMWWKKIKNCYVAQWWQPSPTSCLMSLSCWPSLSSALPSSLFLWITAQLQPLSAYLYRTDIISVSYNLLCFIYNFTSFTFAYLCLYYFRIFFIAILKSTRASPHPWLTSCFISNSLDIFVEY